jgi:rhodanese-related sulfurtransferase
MCRSGKRSAVAIMQLEQQGFTNLYNLQGGITAWAQEIDPTLQVY